MPFGVEIPQFPSLIRHQRQRVELGASEVREITD